MPDTQKYTKKKGQVPYKLRVPNTCTLFWWLVWLRPPEQSDITAQRATVTGSFYIMIVQQLWPVGHHREDKSYEDDLQMITVCG